MKYASVLELAQRSDSEGGVAEFVFGFGVRMDELPDELPSHIRAFFRQLNACSPALDEISRYLDDARENAEEAYRDY